MLISWDQKFSSIFSCLSCNRPDIFNILKLIMKNDLCSFSCKTNITEAAAELFVERNSYKQILLGTVISTRNKTKQNKTKVMNTDASSVSTGCSLVWTDKEKGGKHVAEKSNKNNEKKIKHISWYLNFTVKPSQWPNSDPRIIKAFLFCPPQW